MPDDKCIDCGAPLAGVSTDCPMCKTGPRCMECGAKHFVAHMTEASDA